MRTFQHSEAELTVWKTHMNLIDPRGVGEIFSTSLSIEFQIGILSPQFTFPPVVLTSYRENTMNLTLFFAGSYIPPAYLNRNDARKQLFERILREDGSNLLHIKSFKPVDLPKDCHKIQLFFGREASEHLVDWCDIPAELHQPDLRDKAKKELFNGCEKIENILSYSHKDK